MKWIIAVVTALTVFIIGGIAYSKYYNLDTLATIYYLFSLFFVDLKAPVELGLEDVKDGWQIIYIAGLLATFLVSWAVISLYLKIIGSNFKKLISINFKDNIFVIGLGEGNKEYIKSELNSGTKDIIAIELNSNRAKELEDSIIVEVGDAKDKELLKKLKIKKAKHIVISVGNDLENINIAKAILDINKDAKIFLHINDRSLRELNRKGGVIYGKNIRIFSYYEESARELFSKNYIDGNSFNIIKSDKKFRVVVVGNSALAKEIIAQACVLAQMPNCNKLTIYAIDLDKKSFKDEIFTTFSSIDLIKNIKLKFISADVNSKKFYNLKLWEKDNITNIFLCYEDGQKNLDIALNLTNLVFLDRAVDKSLGFKIFIAMSDSGELSSSVKSNSNIFSHIDIFAQTKSVSSKENIVSAKRDALAIGVNFVYSQIGAEFEDYKTFKLKYFFYDDKKSYKKGEYIEIEKGNWDELSYFLKESNRSVADHMSVKLKYLGLKAIESSEDKKTIFKNNYELFSKKLDNLEKLAICEHNRWMAFHYINGYKPMQFIKKSEKKAKKDILENKKRHMCLVDFSEFKNRASKLESLGYGVGEFEKYDAMIVEHIPHILAYANMKIVEI